MSRLDQSPGLLEGAQACRRAQPRNTAGARSGGEASGLSGVHAARQAGDQAGIESISRAGRIDEQSRRRNGRDFQKLDEAARPAEATLRAATSDSSEYVKRISARTLNKLGTSGK